jgi:hypothetical protein
MITDKFGSSTQFATLSRIGSSLGSSTSDSGETPELIRPEIDTESTLGVTNEDVENRLRKVQLANRQVYQTLQAMVVVTDAIGDLEDLLSRLDWAGVGNQENADESFFSTGSDHLTDVRQQLTQAQQDVSQLQRRFEQKTSDWMAHLPYSESDFSVIRKTDQAKKEKEWIRHQITENSRLAVEVQVEQISNQVLVSLS